MLSACARGAERRITLTVELFIYLVLLTLLKTLLFAGRILLCDTPSSARVKRVLWSRDVSMSSVPKLQATSEKPPTFLKNPIMLILFDGEMNQSAADNEHCGVKYR